MENILDVVLIIGLFLFFTVVIIGMFFVFFGNTKTFKAIDERVAERIRRK